jgi:hypothetical protein
LREVLLVSQQTILRKLNSRATAALQPHNAVMDAPPFAPALLCTFENGAAYRADEG